jgi:hypothetical protein
MEKLIIMRLFPFLARILLLRLQSATVVGRFPQRFPWKVPGNLQGGSWDISRENRPGISWSPNP